MYRILIKNQRTNAGRVLIPKNGRHLIERDGMDYEEATEYIDYNCLGAWIGEQTPIIVMPIEQ